MKKTLSLILALLMSVSCASYIFADDAEVTAISEDAAVEEAVEEAPAEEATPYDRAIRFLTTYNVMHGYEDGLLHAEKDVERYQMALFIGRITTGWVEDDTWEDFDANDSGFSDLKGTAAENVYGAMSYVSQKGIIEGYPDGTFKPEQVVTYREALTMAVRALGYQGLEYPWGYIEKAVSLGLTDGITGVAYTDVINRGVAAQIIYNAMFADGSKLAAKNFDGALGWANIIITSSVVTDKVTVRYSSDDYKTPADYVSFQVIEKDGTLGKEIYYVKASELALDKGHADELAVGTPYAALFRIDDDDNYVELIDFDAYAATTIKNEGRTDNEGVENEVVDNIKAYLADYTLVEKYNTKLLSNPGKLNNEIIVKTTGTYAPTKIDYTKANYAFDWATGNILTIDTDKSTKDEPVWKVEWYYSEIGDYYFNYILKDVKLSDGTTKVEIAGVDIMDEADVAAIRDSIQKAITVEDTSKKINVYNTILSVSANAYAALATYDLDNDDLAEYAMFENYVFTQISQDKVATDNCGEKAAIKFNNVKYVLDSAACEHTDGYWWQDEYAPVLDEDGKIVTAYVIGSVNPVTKEVKVIKTIEKYSDDLVDADTYYATGVLRGYSISKGYVVIGDQKIDFNSYYGDFALDFSKKDKEVSVNKLAISKYLDGLFNQFVTYYVLDGEVVKIEAKGATSTNYIVVESYAGISNDGYIVVNGYSTDDLKLDRFKIAVYNQWNNGDYFWYGFENNAAAAFVKGQVYKITSYDAENDLYFVDLMAEVTDNDLCEVVTDAPVVTLTFNQGYRIYKEAGEKAASPKKVSSSDKYIIIGEGKKGYMPIAVYEGKVTDDTWTVTGNLLVGAADKTTFIFVNARTTGFNLDAWSNAGLVMVLNKTVLDKFFDGAGLDEDEWYLNGATEVGNILVFNFLNGTFEYATSATNVNVAKGNVYKTIDNVIVERFTNVWWNATGDSIYTEIESVYADKAYTTTADYIFDSVVTVDKYFFEDGNKDYVSLHEVSEKFLKDGLEVKGLVNSLKIVKLDLDEKTNVVENILPYGKDEFKKDIENNGIESFVAAGVYKINENGTVDAVIYVTDVVAAGVNTGDAKVVPSENVIKLAEDAAIAADVTAKKTVKTVNGKDTVSYKVTNIGFSFIGSGATKQNHATVQRAPYFFDYLGRCDINADLGTELYVAELDKGWDEGTKIYEQDIEFNTYKYEDCDCDFAFEGTILEHKCALISDFNFDCDVDVVEGYTTWVGFYADNFGPAAQILDEEETYFTLGLTIVDGELEVVFAGGEDDNYFYNTPFDAEDLVARSTIK